MNMNDDEPSIPLVKLNIENITYEPMTKTYNSNTSTSAKVRYQNFMKRFKKGDGDYTNNTNKKESRQQQQQVMQRKTILKNVTPPPIEPFKLQAWLGPSGSGKTTLLSIASGVLDFDRESDAFTDERSRITMNNDPINFLQGRQRQQKQQQRTRNKRNDKSSLSYPKGLIGVVWQDDLLLSNLTVRETIEFAAKLKTSTNNSHRIDEMVDQVLEDLNLTSVQYSLIGQSSLGEGRGISGGERKRVSVAQELVTRPSLLFLDEPTSGKCFFFAALTIIL